VPTIILFQRAENARFLRKISPAPRQRCTDRNQRLRGAVTYLNSFNMSIDYQACAWLLSNAARRDFEVCDSSKLSHNCVSVETDLGNFFLPAVLSLFGFRPTAIHRPHRQNRAEGWCIGCASHTQVGTYVINRLGSSYHHLWGVLSLSLPAKKFG
jgi:hypothetical protein